MNLWSIPKMSESRRRGVYVGACGGLLVFSATLVWLATGVEVPLPWYEPLERRWIVSARAPTNVAMDFYARVGVSFLAALIAGPLAGFLASKRAMSPSVVRAIGIWAVGITLLGMFLYGFALGTRVIEPPYP